MTRTDDRSRVAPTTDWSLRLAGGALVVVGVLNLGLGLTSLLTDQIRLHVGAAGGLAVAGLVTAAIGVLVWRGSRLATTGAAVVFGLLLIVQLGDLGTGADDGAWGRFALLALLVGVLGLAALRQRRR